MCVDTWQMLGLSFLQLHAQELARLLRPECNLDLISEATSWTASPAVGGATSKSTSRQSSWSGKLLDSLVTLMVTTYGPYKHMEDLHTIMNALWTQSRGKHGFNSKGLRQEALRCQSGSNWEAHAYRGNNWWQVFAVAQVQGSLLDWTGSSLTEIFCLRVYRQSSEGHSN